jgi:hypothetical protein
MAGNDERPSRPWGYCGLDLPLAHGVGPDRHLRASCRSCGRQVVFDPTPWIGERLGGHRLTWFESRLRCLCGGRSARLEIWTGPAPTTELGAGIYPFR